MIESLPTPPYRVQKGGGTKARARHRGAHLKRPSEGQSRAAGHKPLTPALRSGQSPAPPHMVPPSKHLAQTRRRRASLRHETPPTAQQKSQNRLDASPVRALCDGLCNSLAGLGRSWSVGGALTAASIGAAKGGGYARYLESKTVEPERGDYYLTPDGEPTQAPGRWLASPETLARLGDRGQRGRGPGFRRADGGPSSPTGRWLRREGAGGDAAAGST